MATTYIPININNGFQSATSINANFLDIQQDLDRKLSRFGDENAQLGDLDNAMQTVFDMNDNRGLNCPYPEDKPEWNYDLVPKIYIDQLINQLIDWDKVGIATTTIFGISLLATDQDAIDGIDDSKNLTPSNLPPVLNAKVPDILIDQIINNPQIINEILAKIGFVNLGLGQGVFKQKNGSDVELYSLRGVNGTTVNLNGDTIDIGGGGGDVTNAQNIGLGTGVFSSKVGGVLQLRSLRGINGTTVTLNGSTLDIDGGGGGNIVDALLANTGYVQFGNGYMEQWTSLSFANENTSVNWVFPKAFTSACYGITFSHKLPSGAAVQGAMDFGPARTTAQSITQATIYMNDWGVGGATLFVRAVGR